MKFLFINSDTNPKRQQNIENEFKKHNVNFERISAITPDTLNPVKRQLEICCLKSHIKAIKHFIDNVEDDYVIICEDDLCFEFIETFFNSSFNKIIKKIMKELLPSDFGILQLGCILQGISNKFRNKDIVFKYSEQPTSSTISYLVNKEYAKILVENYSKMSDQLLPTADCFRRGIFTKMPGNFQAYTIKYPIFTYPENNISTIGNSQPLHISSKTQQKSFLSANKKEIQEIFHD